jgi:hypothetical protein
MEFGSVSVPSLGTFALQYADAAFKNEKTLLTPPSSKITFTKDDTVAGPLQDLLTESGMQESDAQMVQSLLVTEYQKTLERQHPFELDGFGTVVNHVFLPKDNKFFDKYNGLNEIAIKPVPLPVTHDEDYLYRLKTNQKIENESSFKQYLWPLLIGIFVASFILMWFMSDKEPIEKKESISEVVQIVPYEDNIISDTLISVDTIVKIIKEEEDTIPSTNQQKLEPTIKSSVKPSVTIHKNANNTCVVIVGAFKDSANANKLLKSIAARGYKTYTAQHDGLKRVGVSYDCTTLNPDDFKSKVKKMFNKDAWHLHDTL